MMTILAIKDKKKIEVIVQNRYEYIIFLIPILGLLFSIGFGFLHSRLRLVLNHILMYLFFLLLGGTLIYIMLVSGAYKNNITLIIFFILVVCTWIVVPIILTYSLIYFIDYIYILNKINEHYYIEEEDLKDVYLNCDGIFKKIFLRRKNV